MKKTFLFLFIALQIGVSAQNWDIDLLKQINPNTVTSYDPFMKTISNSVLPLEVGIPTVMLVSGLLSKDKAYQNRALYMFGGLALNEIITFTSKEIFKRDRPYVAYPGDIFNRSISSDFSFPSGHTSNAFALATMVSLDQKKWYVTVPAFVWAGTVAYSRMYLGAHYPTDVIGGLVIGVGVGFLQDYIVHKYFN
jgi:membrane-associated phospholipid phosphatase